MGIPFDAADDEKWGYRSVLVVMRSEECLAQEDLSYTGPEAWWRRTPFVFLFLCKPTQLEFGFLSARLLVKCECAYTPARWSAYRSAVSPPAARPLVFQKGHVACIFVRLVPLTLALDMNERNAAQPARRSAERNVHFPDPVTDSRVWR